MATIKSFTDLNQAKVLSKILPLESADMCYIQDLLAGCKYGEYRPYIGDLFPAYGQEKIRCWSLAALHGILSENKICHYNDRYYCQYINEGDGFPIYSTLHITIPLMLATK